MKKTIIWSLAIMMGLSLALIAPLSAEESADNAGATAVMATTTNANNDIKTRELVGGREKILSPQQICLYKDIVRHGNTLYGVARSEGELAASSANCPAATPVLEKLKQLPEQARAQVKTATKQMEKIAAPWLVHQYEQIKQVGNALWGLKKDSDKTPPTNATTTPPVVAPAQAYVQPANVACVINAIKTKDAALEANNASTTLALNAAVAVRAACQEVALNATVTASSTASTIVLMNQQKTAMSLCLQSFRESQAALKTQTVARHTEIWTAYKNALMVCQPAASSTPALMVEDGGGNLSL